MKYVNWSIKSGHVRSIAFLLRPGKHSIKVYNERFHDHNLNVKKFIGLIKKLYVLIKKFIDEI